MHLQSAAALALLTGAAVASPLEERAPKKKFSFKQVPSKGKVAPPAVQVFRTHQKYAGVSRVPTNIRTAAKKQSKLAASVNATPYSNDLAYLVQVVIGGTRFDLNFDTGSSDLWTYSNLQPSAQQAGHPVYNPKRSGKVINGATWDITYGDGSGAQGVVYADAVTVGAMTATSQAVEAATSVSSDMLQDTVSDGIVGLGFQSINAVSPNTQRTFFDTIASSLQSKLFAVSLRRNQPGSYDFGYINSTRFTGSLAYSPVTKGGNGQYGYWKFSSLNGFQVGSRGRIVGSLGDGVVDTGTTLLYLPDNVVKAYYAQVANARSDDSQGGWIFPCKNSIPNLTLQVAGQWYTIPGSIINYSPLPSDSKTCFGGLQSSADIGMNILGDIFLKAMYVVFDQSQSTPRIGFASQR